MNIYNYIFSKTCRWYYALHSINFILISKKHWQHFFFTVLMYIIVKARINIKKLLEIFTIKLYKKKPSTWVRCWTSKNIRSNYWPPTTGHCTAVYNATLILLTQVRWTIEKHLTLDTLWPIGCWRVRV